MLIVGLDNSMQSPTYKIRSKNSNVILLLKNRVKNNDPHNYVTLVLASFPDPT